MSKSISNKAAIWTVSAAAILQVAAFDPVVPVQGEPRPAYFLSSTEYCSESYAYIKSQSECGTAASFLNLSSTTASSVYLKGNPYGCFWGNSSSSNIVSCRCTGEIDDDNANVAYAASYTYDDEAGTSSTAEDNANEDGEDDGKVSVGDNARYTICRTELERNMPVNKSWFKIKDKKRSLSIKMKKPQSCHTTGCFVPLTLQLTGNKSELDATSLDPDGMRYATLVVSQSGDFGFEKYTIVKIKPTVVSSAITTLGSCRTQGPSFFTCHSFPILDVLKASLADTGDLTVIIEANALVSEATSAGAGVKKRDAAPLSVKVELLIGKAVATPETSKFASKDPNAPQQPGDPCTSACPDIGATPMYCVKDGYISQNSKVCSCLNMTFIDYGGNIDFNMFTTKPKKGKTRIMKKNIQQGAYMAFTSIAIFFVCCGGCCFYVGYLEDTVLDMNPREAPMHRANAALFWFQFFFNICLSGCGLTFRHFGLLQRNSMTTYSDGSGCVSGTPTKWDPLSDPEIFMRDHPPDEMGYGLGYADQWFGWGMYWMSAQILILVFTICGHCIAHRYSMDQRRSRWVFLLSLLVLVVEGLAIGAVIAAADGNLRLLSSGGVWMMLALTLVLTVPIIIGGFQSMDFNVVTITNLTLPEIEVKDITAHLFCKSFAPSSWTTPEETQGVSTILLLNDERIFVWPERLIWDPTEQHNSRGNYSHGWDNADVRKRGSGFWRLGKQEIVNLEADGDHAGFGPFGIDKVALIEPRQINRNYAKEGERVVFNIEWQTSYSGVSGHPTRPCTKLADRVFLRKHLYVKAHADQLALFHFNAKLKGLRREKGLTNAIEFPVYTRATGGKEIIYPNIETAARVTGLHKSIISAACKTGGDAHGRGFEVIHKVGEICFVCKDTAPDFDCPVPGCVFAYHFKCADVDKAPTDLEWMCMCCQQRVVGTHSQPWYDNEESAVKNHEELWDQRGVEDASWGFLLKGAPSGTFVVRPSNDAGAVAVITIAKPGGARFNQRVIQISGSSRVRLNGSKHTHSSIDEMIKFYQDPMYFAQASQPDVPSPLVFPSFSGTGGGSVSTIGGKTGRKARGKRKLKANYKSSRFVTMCANGQFKTMWWRKDTTMDTSGMGGDEEEVLFGNIKDDVDGGSKEQQAMFDRMVSGDVTNAATPAYNPLAGLAGTPKVSFKEAVKLLNVHCKGDLVADSKAALRYASNHLDLGKELRPGAGALTVDDIAVLYFYTMEKPDFYRRLNEELGGYGRGEKHSAIDEVLAATKLLAAAMAKLPTDPIKMFRGVKRTYKLILGEDVKEGDSVKWNQFTSCSTKPEILKDENFLGPETEGTVFQIMGVTGINIKPYSALPDEDEYVLPPGSEFAVDKITSWKYGVYEVRMRQIVSTRRNSKSRLGHEAYDDVKDYMSLAYEVSSA